LRLNNKKSKEMKTKLVKLAQKILCGEANNSEKKRHDYLLIHSDEYAKEYYELKKTWDNSENAFGNYIPDTVSAWKKVSERTIHELKVRPEKQRNKKAALFPMVRYAAAAAIIIGLATVIFFISRQKNFNIKTSYASADNRLEILLEDSSVVWLNRNSLLKVLGNFNEGRRELVLKGEAFFEVKKNSAKPFIIYTGNTVTRVIGTSFNLFENIERDRVEIAVNEGKVLFTTKKPLHKRQQIILLASEKGQYSNSTHKIEKIKLTDKNYLSWKTREIKFKNTPIAEVCELLSHDFNMIITAEGNNINEIRLTASFKNKSLDEILNIISLTINAQIIRQEGKIVIRIKTP
jgi:transmembrane sensor